MHTHVRKYVDAYVCMYIHTVHKRGMNEVIDYSIVLASTYVRVYVCIRHVHTASLCVQT